MFASKTWYRLPPACRSKDFFHSVIVSRRLPSSDPIEQIRLDVALHGLNVKIVGNGGGYGYGIMGASHHALEDIAVLSALQTLLLFRPSLQFGC